MESLPIKDLLLLLEKGDVSKDELIFKINKIQFQPVFSDPTTEFTSQKMKGLLRRTRTTDESFSNKQPTRTSLSGNAEEHVNPSSPHAFRTLLPNTNSPSHTQGVSHHRQAPSMAKDRCKISSLSLARRAHHSGSRSSESLRSASVMRYLHSKESQLRMLESLRKALNSCGSRRQAHGNCLGRKPEARPSAALNPNFSLTERPPKARNCPSVKEPRSVKKKETNFFKMTRESEYFSPKNSAEKVKPSKHSSAQINGGSQGLSKKSRNGFGVANQKESDRAASNNADALLKSKRSTLLSKKLLLKHSEPPKSDQKHNNAARKMGSHNRFFSSDQLLGEINTKEQPERRGKNAKAKNIPHTKKDAEILLKAAQNINKLQFNIKDKTGVKTQEIIMNLHRQMNACIKMVKLDGIRKRPNPLLVGSK